MKLQMPKFIRRTLSVRLSLMVVTAMAILLLGSMAVMLHYSRKAVKEEALQKASQTLEGIVQRVDNILLSVEQSSGNIYLNLLPHLGEPGMIELYTRQLVASNPYIVDCVLAFKTDSAYASQPWFVNSMELRMPGWQDPSSSKENDSQHPTITFCLPVLAPDGEPVAVMGVDVSLSLLSQIVLEAKPSENSYCTLLAGDGTFLVYPDSSKLFKYTVFTLNEDTDNPKSVSDAAKAMISGETGYKPFCKNGTNYYVFYKPFQRVSITARSMAKLEWSAGIIYPEDDIFGDYNSLLYYVLAIAFGGLLLLLILSCIIIHHQLKRLRTLTASAQRIAQGSFHESIPESRRQDEIGRLQNNFKQMQSSLSTHIGELEELTATLKERSEELRTAYNAAQKADRMKTAFLHNMTNQMQPPADAIERDVRALGKEERDKGKEESTEKRLVDIQKNGHAITELLNNLINMSDDELGNSRKDADKPMQKKGGRL